jgi:hypothetical protein
MLQTTKLVAAFEDGTLPKAQWTHQAHLTTALWYLRQYGRARATALLRTNIPRYNKAAGGSPDGYHETVTLAWVAVIQRFLEENDRGQPFATLRDQLVAQCGDKDYLLRYYTRDLLQSDAARRKWTAPDLGPID